MPLTFLTDERAVMETPDETTARLDDRSRWRRPYRPGPYRVGAAALLMLLAAYVLFAGVIIALAGPLKGAGACLALAAVLIALALRLLRMGAWVSERGVRRVGLLSTTTLPWRRLASVRTTQQPVKWLGLPRTVQGQALLAVPLTGEPPRPLLTDHNADFLGRSEAFARACDAIEAWADEYRR
ncbi:hypothetical protein [Streptomyces sp. TP-A0874]|uniref:hypothetical protein n=1 Tax=Streptomyces sp. TP-A0874 TaxID=549819 RepID=UPI000852D250|nr:hypothetical protein [Streptomyces sp. TP-A0874]